MWNMKWKLGVLGACEECDEEFPEVWVLQVAFPKEIFLI